MTVGRDGAADSEMAKTDATSGEELPRRRRAAIFAVVTTALLMSSLDGTIVATALHSIQHGLHASLNWTSWTITAYSVGMVLSLSVAARLSDRLGRRRLFLVSVCVFTAASLCCGLATNIYVLIALRAVQAAGGAGFTPSATGIVVENFGSSRDKAVGLFGSMFPTGALIGPIFGGLFVTYWTWRGIFFVNVPIGALLVVGCVKFVPHDAERARRVRQPLDKAGMALLGVGMLAMMLAISDLGESGTKLWAPDVIGPAVVAVLGLGQFARHIGRVANPFITPRFIAGKGFAAVNLVNILYGGASTGLINLVPLYAVTRYRISPLGSGTLLTADGIAAVAVSASAAMALRRTGYRRPLYVSSVLLALCMAAFAFRPPGISAYAWLAVVACVAGVGSGLSSPAGRNAGLQLAPDQSAAIAALRTTGRQIGTIASISITTAILAHSTHGHSDLAASLHQGDVQAKVYLAFALLLVLFLPVIGRVPEHRGSW